MSTPMTLSEIYKDFQRRLRKLDEGQLCARLREYGKLPDDWDGYGGHSAHEEAINDAVNFILSFPANLKLPKPMVAGSGLAGLYWRKNNIYASIDFDGSKSYCYLVDRFGVISGEGDVEVGSTLPLALRKIVEGIGSDVV